MSTTDLDADEQSTLEAFDAGMLTSTASPERLASLRESARSTMLKDRRVNIRMTSSDLANIQTRALREGMPYQTLIASVMHKYVTGQLIER
jgi:predicted DNA binding CopG/RHH family protein